MQRNGFPEPERPARHTPPAEPQLGCPEPAARQRGRRGGRCACGRQVRRCLCLGPTSTGPEEEGVEESGRTEGNRRSPDRSTQNVAAAEREGGYSQCGAGPHPSRTRSRGIRNAACFDSAFTICMAGLRSGTFPFLLGVEHDKGPALRGTGVSPAPRPARDTPVLGKRGAGNGHPPVLAVC